jgi:hypothetical protein
MGGKSGTRPLASIVRKKVTTPSSEIEKASYL